MFSSKAHTFQELRLETIPLSLYSRDSQPRRLDVLSNVVNRKVQFLSTSLWTRQDERMERYVKTFQDQVCKGGNGAYLEFHEFQVVFVVLENYMSLVLNKWNVQTTQQQQLC